MAAGGFARASAAEPADMDFEPVKQTVTAQVDARFGMLLPESNQRTRRSPARSTAGTDG
jgi:hypothetical protein